LSYKDDADNSLKTDITDYLNNDIFAEFINDEYGKNPTDSYLSTIELSPAEYERTTLNGLYFNGQGPASISGIKSKSWVNDNKTYYYVINGINLYLVEESGSDVAAVKIEGFPCWNETLIDPVTDLEMNYNNNEWTYTSHSGKKLPAGASLYIFDDTHDLPDQVYTGSNSLGGIVQTNTSNVDKDISFVTNESLGTQYPSDSPYPFKYKAYIVHRYYQIESITLDYNTDAQGASKYISPNATYPYGQGSENTITNPSGNVDENGNPCGYITIRTKEIASNRVQTFALAQNTCAWKYDDIQSSETYTADPAIVERKWYYTNANEENSYISDADFINDVFNEWSFNLQNRTIDKWFWPINDFSVKLVAQQIFIGE